MPWVSYLYLSTDDQRLLIAVMMRLSQISNDRKILKRDDLYIGNRINIQYLCKALAHQQTLAIPLLQQLVNNFKSIVTNQPNIWYIEEPALVIGDIHGQFYDLVKILSHTNALRNDRQLQTKLVFLGDYVDRGINAMQVMILLICLKIQYPESVFLLRGNHQSRIMTQQYNFKSQCCLKYSQEIYLMMVDLFDLLPLACVINNSYFCVHGGISDKIIDITKINKINRKMEIPVTPSAFCDFIWSDPIDSSTGTLQGRSAYNSSRDCSIFFGAELTKQFLRVNNLSAIIRGHEVFLQGYKTYNWNEIKPSSSIITIFSAPNYCGTCGNKAAVLKIENDSFKIKQFRQQQPEKSRFLFNFDVFTWTLPQIMSNVKQIVFEMMESIIQSNIPEMKNIQPEKKLELFLTYAKKQNLIVPLQKVSSGLLKVKQFASEQQQRNFLLNRSHELYVQKVPKNH